MSVALPSKGVLHGLKVHGLLDDVEIFGYTKSLRVDWSLEWPGIHALLESLQDQIALQERLASGDRLSAVYLHCGRLLQLARVGHQVIGIFEFLLLCIGGWVLLAGLMGSERRDSSSRERVHL
jgi:hypothetical protein